MKKQLLFTVLLTSFLGFSQVSLVKDINPGNGDGIGSGREMIAINNKILFQGNNGVGVDKLWVSDGTSSGTIVRQVGSFNFENPQNFFYFPGTNQVAFSGSFYGNNPIDNELYLDDALTNTNSSSNYNTSGSSFPDDFGLFNSSPGYLVFSAEEPSVGREFCYYFSFGSVTLIKDINPGTASSNPENFTLLSANNLYFTADDGTNGNELWKCTFTNASTTNLFLDINSGSGSSYPSELTIFNNKIYFTADNGTNGRELWVTDGTVSGTHMVLDLYSGSVGSNPTNLTVYNNALYFTATHATLGNEIFKMTTSETITNLKNINAGSASSYPFNLFVFNNELYFVADDGNGVELWKSAGFPSNTNMLKDINPTGESTPQNFCEYYGKLYFVADNGVNGRELWSTDGTSTGTVLVSDINTGAPDASISSLTVSNNVLYFFANDGSTGLELWKYQDPTLSANDFDLTGNEIKLYPNPAKDYFELATNVNVEKVELYNLQGQLVKSFMNQNKYSTFEIQNGMYIVKIFTDKGSVNKTLIKKD